MAFHFSVMFSFFRRFPGVLRRRLGRLLVAGRSPGKWRRLGYYAFFSRAYWREQEAFLAGLKQYEHELLSPMSSAAILRRNTHRLEKGLLMLPRRIPFGTGYIEETVKAYEAATLAGSVEAGEMKWASDVLDEYFRIMPEDHEFLNGLRGRFAAARGGFGGKGDVEQYVPYKRDLSEPCPVGYEALLALAWRRRSVRWFLDRPVPRELIDKAVTVAGLSPSACNRQPFKFRIADDRRLVRRIAEIPFGLGGYGHNVPAIAVIVGQQRCFFDERDRHLIYIDGSLAAMSFVYALESLGLGSCCVNWPDLADREAKMSRLLGLARDERPVMLVAFGYPDPQGMVAYSKKKSLQQLRQYNFETHNGEHSGSLKQAMESCVKD